MKIKPTLDRMLNLIAAETIARPTRKWLVLRGMASVEVGNIVVISPGTRVMGSTIGNNVSMGINAVVENSTVDEGVVITANAVVRNSHLKKGVIIGANAIVEDMTIPPNSIVVGPGKVVGKVNDFKNKKSHRNVTTIMFERNPMWWWTEVSKTHDWLRMPMCVPGHFWMNTVPNFLQSKKLKASVIYRFTNSSWGLDLHPNVIVDPIFPELVSLGKGTTIKKDSVVLTHSFLGYNDHRLEYGPASTGEGVTIGRHCVLIPGVHVPDDQKLPDWSVATKNGYYIVKEDTTVKYE